ncbi:MAG: hypothetical protein KatS3mg110_1634 [Pirellulaceae bacterium]|nr:MAG: hypothetical protein KatS3mg110_1634 [Pirellulaceae bacterium]
MIAGMQVMRSMVAFFILVGAVCGPAGKLGAEGTAEPKRPVAAVALDRWLFVANQRTGSISVVDWQTMRPVRELPDIGLTLADICASEDGSLIVAVDREQSQLVLLERDQDRLTVIDRLATPPDPVQLVWDGRPGTAVLLCRWARLAVVYHVGSRGWEQGRRWPLPFSPREAVFLDHERLVVTDAFGGSVALLDLDRGVQHVHSLTGHNLWGLSRAPTGDRVVLNMQRLNSFRPTSYEDIFWGGVMQNVMVELRIRDLEQPPGSEPIQETVYFLGRPSEGAGDPTDLLISDDGCTVVALGGVHQVAARSTPFAPFEYRQVGKRPIALCRPPGSNSVFVVCQMDDSIHELDLTSLQVVRRLRLTDPLPDDPVSAGEALFYDATLALDGWFSCHSCHTEGHTNGLLNDNFGDDSRGAPKRIPSLLGTAATGPWGWNGRMASLEEQVRKSLTRTMQGGEPDASVVEAIVAYLNTLAPVPGSRRGIQLDEAQLERGRTIFWQRGCGDCHQPPEYTSPATYDVGIHDQVGNTHFNPPSLRGVGLRSALFHDNRAATLRDVFVKFGHPDNHSWSERDVEDLLVFLSSL